MGGVEGSGRLPGPGARGLAIGLQLLVLVLTYLLQEPIMEFVRNFRF